LGWDGQQPSTFWILPFFEPFRTSAGAMGLLELQSVLLDGAVQPFGRSAQVLNSLKLDAVADVSTANTTISLAAPAAPGGVTEASDVILGLLAASAPTNGQLAFINTVMTWRERGNTAAQGDEDKGVPAAAIAVPVAVGGALLVAGAVALLVWRKRKAATTPDISSDSLSKVAKEGGANNKAAPSSLNSSSDEDHELGTRAAGSGETATTQQQGAVTTTSATPSATSLASRGVHSLTAQHVGLHRNSGGTSHTAMTLSVGEQGIPIMRGAADTTNVYLMQQHTSFNTGLSQAQSPSIEQTRTSILAAAAKSSGAGRDETVTLLSVLGEGTFGRVYKANWKGIIVAVKVIVLPSLSGQEKREKMAVMETAISSSLSHPNIVQTYTYSVEPVRAKCAGLVLQPAASPNATLELHQQGPGSGELDQEGVTSWEVRLVQEFCEAGSLRDLLDKKAFVRGSEGIDMPAVLDTAIDVARAMEHLHSQHIVHSDLKPRNILLKANPTSRRGFVAKVADFGLSVRVNPDDTHISNAYQGTMSHMAPETLMHGRVSKAVDVYAFGITLWEIYSGERAFKGVPKVVLGHAITMQGSRPSFPASAPPALVDLAARCWAHDPAARPTFASVIKELQAIRLNLLGADNEASSLAGGHSRSSIETGTNRPHSNADVIATPQASSLHAGNSPGASTVQDSTVLTALAAQALPALQQFARAPAPEVAAAAALPMEVQPASSLLPPAPTPAQAAGVMALDPLQMLLIATSTAPSVARVHDGEGEGGSTAVLAGAMLGGLGSERAPGPQCQQGPADQLAGRGSTLGMDRPTPPRATPQRVPSMKRGSSNGSGHEDTVQLGVGGVVNASLSYQTLAEQQIKAMCSGEQHSGGNAADEQDRSSSQRSTYLEDSSSSSNDEVITLKEQAAALYAQRAAARLTPPPPPPGSLLHERIEERSDEGLTTTKLLLKQEMAANNSSINESRFQHLMLANASTVSNGPVSGENPISARSGGQ